MKSLSFVVILFVLLTDVLTLAAGTRTPWTSGRVVGSPNPPAPYLAVRAYPQASFENAVDFSFAPGTTRLHVAEQSGKLWSLDTAIPGAARELVFDLRQHHRPLDSVLGFTFHPGFATNRFIFINYNEPGGRDGGSVISRFTVGTVNPPVIDPGSERVILRWFSGGHNGCTLAFGPDGMLYISTGDGADPDPPDGKFKTGQNLGDLLAAILRIDVDHPNGTNAYRIPADNPFVNTPGARGENWAFGFRNPFRMSFDKATGDLWAGDVGWEQWEMVYRVQRGGNYGWPLHEGPNLNVRRDIQSGPGEILPPVHSVSHTDGASITGGCVYRGKRLPGLAGAYVYGDWETGKFWALRHRDGVQVSNEELCDTTLKPTAFTLDPRGELFVLDYNSGIHEFVSNTAPAANTQFPRRLSDTGIFSSLTPLQPAPGVEHYRIAAPKWDDHAIADRWLAVPGDAAMRTEGGVGNIAGGTWFFPSNTVLVRTLTLEMRAGQSASARRIETQLLHWDGQGWNPYTYRWRSDGADADLVDGNGTNDNFTVIDALAPGGVRETPWRFMSRSECLRCHNAWAGDALTLTPLQLAATNLTGAGRSEWERLIDVGLIETKRRTVSGNAMSNPHDLGAPLEARARSWLHVNCAGCHRFGAGGAVAIHLNYEKAPGEWRALNEKPARGDFGLADARIIAGGAPYRSALFYRLFTEGAGHMPQIGSRHVDAVGARAVRDWIRSLGSGGAVAEVAPASRDAAISQTSLALQLLDVATDIPATLAEHPAELARHRKVCDELATLAQTQTNAFVRELFQRLLPPDQRRRTLGPDIQPAIILSLHGDAARGRAVFHGIAQCARCHVAGGEGRVFGPVLAGLARRFSRAQLLDQILFPSRIVAPEFKSFNLVLKNGSELNGFIVRRDADGLVMRDELTGDHRLAAGDIAETRESTLSAMPEGLLDVLTGGEAADLLEYLLSLPEQSGVKRE